MNENILRERAIELIQRQKRTRQAIRAAIIFLSGLALGVLAKSVFLHL